MFIDTAVIHVQAGKGGDGAVSFRREKYVPAGGPDGGDGGRGGHIYLKSDSHLQTLSDYRYKTKYKAPDGERGGGQLCAGKGGSDITLKLPLGTLIYDDESGRLLCDLSTDEPFLLCKGGRGGFGNKKFANSTRQAPQFAKSGTSGEELRVRLEVKIIADVGLVGFPNVGKSTIISKISAARPKIANYPFTTLIPNLGVVSLDPDTAFVCADIPGLIEGAAGGAGLGLEFLRHVERCRLLLHIVDGAALEGRDPLSDINIINQELSEHSSELASKEQIIVINKSDVISDETIIERIKAHVEPLKTLIISAATGEGLDTLIKVTAEKLQTLPPIKVFTPDPVPIAPAKTPAATEIEQQDGVWVITGDWLIRLMRDVNFDDTESLNYFEKCLKSNGVYDMLLAEGISEGDTVSIYGLEFDYVN